MKITRKQLKNLIKEAMLSEASAYSTEGTTKFKNILNDFLRSYGIEPGVVYYWNDEDTLVVRGGEDNANDIQSMIVRGIDMEILRTGSSTMNPSVVELDNGSWAVKLNAQMTQDRL